MKALGQRLLSHLRRSAPKLAPRYYCNALQGGSNYNICVNSDMTVSCNCQDFDGTGQIGSLAERSLAGIMHGDQANRFRQALAAGSFPTTVCFRCIELRHIPPEIVDLSLYLHDYTLPRFGIMVENTSVCNLSCAGCDREKLSQTRASRSLSLNDLEVIARNLAECGICFLSYHNLGEPFCSPRIRDELTTIRRHCPDIIIHCSTNGMLLDREQNREAALLVDHLFVSIDGACDESVARYQVGAEFSKQYANLRSLVALRNERKQLLPVIEWKYVVFRWNESPEEIETAFHLAREAGVDIISYVEGGAEPEARSERYWRSDYFQRLCSQTPRGKEIQLRLPSTEQIGWLLQKLQVPAWQDQLYLILDGNKSLAEVCLGAINDPEQSFNDFVIKAYTQLLGDGPAELFGRLMQMNKTSRLEVLRFFLSQAEFWRNFRRSD